MVAGETDPELEAMSSVLAKLSALDREAQARVLRWVSLRLGIDDSEQLTMTAGSAVLKFTGPQREGTVTTVAARLAVKSCRDLMVAAAIHLSLYQGKERFSRTDWVACAKEAKQWKVDYSVQTATAIGRLLIAGFVNETAKDVFSVPDDELKNIEARL
ncbi:MAG: hypothetical protein EKK41_23570 [Hyphomicrobiales bacterium]|nr:MAG: hypothetical protein EKK41_23570 [Hyphomicrobiales bacterium]